METRLDLLMTQLLADKVGFRKIFKEYIKQVKLLLHVNVRNCKATDALQKKSITNVQAYELSDQLPPRKSPGIK